MSVRFKNSYRWILLVFSLLFSLIFAEILLRMSGFRATYGEKNGGQYISPFPNFDDRFLLYPPSTDSLLSECFEFRNFRRSNSLGLISDDFDFKKDTGLFRIITFGDSNTEGIGAVKDSSWPAQLETYARQLYPGQKIEVINAGIAGSDMVFSLDLLEQKLIRAAPDLVILETNPTDLDDLAIRGGFERFQNDKIQLRREAPVWEFFYAHSKLFRAFFHSIYETDFYFRTVKEQASDKVFTEQLIDKLLSRYSEICRRQHTYPCVLINASLNDLQMPVAHRLHYRLISRLCKEKQIKYLDIFSAYNEIPSAECGKYFWPVDRHPNAIGYSVMAKASSEFLAIPLSGGRP